MGMALSSLQAKMNRQGKGNNNVQGRVIGKRVVVVTGLNLE